MEWALLFPKALGRKLALTGWLTAAKQLAEVVLSSSHAHCTPFCTEGWESDLPVCCHGVPVYLLWIMGRSGCALSRGFAGDRESERLCTVWPGAEATPLAEAYLPPLPLSHHHRDFQCLGENRRPLPETHFWGFHPVWVNAASFILQTIVIRMWVICMRHLKQVKCPSKHQRIFCHPELSVQPTRNRSCFNNSILSFSFFPGSAVLTVSRFGSSSVSTIW